MRRRPCELTVGEALRAIADGSLSAEGLTRDVLARIDEVQPRLHPFVTVAAGEALRDARRVDAARARGRRVGPLGGIPIALKDLIDLRGVPTGAGSPGRIGHIAARDATVAARLRAAGAVIIGKTVTHQWAFGVTSPPARCAWDPSRIPGGSSGGSAVAVASGACLAALGTDTGCSIRNPAALNGVVGLKPTYGRVSRSGVVPLSWSSDHVGPITRTVADCARVLQVIAGRDARDPTSARQRVPDFSACLNSEMKGIRLGIPRNYFFEDIAPEVETAVREGIRQLERQGATLVEVDVPFVEHAMTVSVVLAITEGGSVHGEHLVSDAAAYDADIRASLAAGQLLLARHYLDAQRVRSLLSAGIRRVYAERRLDALVAPTSPITAPLCEAGPTSTGGESPRRPLNQELARLAAPFNLTGQPALSVPCGLDHHGLPIGLQIVGKPFDEGTVLQIGHAYEQAAQWGIAASGAPARHAAGRTGPTTPHALTG